MSNHCMTIGFNFEGDFFDQISTINYDGFAIDVVSGKKESCHNLMIPLSNEIYKEAFKAGCRFLNEFCWVNKVAIYIIGTIYGTGKPKISDKNNLGRIDKYIIHDFHQIASKDEQHIALGFYREGFSSKSPFYKFLSYYKILNIKCIDGNAHKRWVNNNIKHIRYSHFAIDRLKTEGVTNVGEFLWRQGRCALAHASIQKNQPIIDVADYDHWQKIVWCNDLLQELVELFIQNELSISTSW